jgi:hypothetical protein
MGKSGARYLEYILPQVKKDFITLQFMKKALLSENSCRIIPLFTKLRQYSGGFKTLVFLSLISPLTLQILIQLKTPG